MNTSRQAASSLRNAGLTLVEVLVVVGLSTVLMVTITLVVIQYYQYNDYLIAQRDAVANARQGMNIMTRDLREMAFAADGSYPLIERSEFSIAFFANVDNDDMIERVEYEVVANQLIRRIYKPSDNPPAYNLATSTEERVVASFVRNQFEDQPLFTYTDSSGATVASSSPLTTIRSVTIDIRINLDPGRIDESFALTSRVTPRNLRQDL